MSTAMSSGCRQQIAASADNSRGFVMSEPERTAPPMVLQTVAPV
jgi:hypothetical protein